MVPAIEQIRRWYSGVAVNVYDACQNGVRHNGGVPKGFPKCTLGLTALAKIIGRQVIWCVEILEEYSHYHRKWQIINLRFLSLTFRKKMEKRRSGVGARGTSLTGVFRIDVLKQGMGDTDGQASRHREAGKNRAPARGKRWFHRCAKLDIIIWLLRPIILAGDVGSKCSCEVLSISVL